MKPNRILRIMVALVFATTLVSAMKCAPGKCGTNMQTNEKKISKEAKNNKETKACNSEKKCKSGKCNKSMKCGGK
jgi:hypothetical protein